MSQVSPQHRAGMDPDTEDSMLQLAARAFQAKNFDLAADIYGCQLADVGDPDSRQELMVKRADALVFGGKIAEALDVYRQASCPDRLRPAQLAKLIEYLSGNIRRQDGGDGRGQEAAGAAGTGHEELCCRMCSSFLFEPVTLPCGHSFCRKCLEREKKRRPFVCRDCKTGSKENDVQNYRVNVVLSSLLAKWFPNLYQAARLRREGNELYGDRKLEAALDRYNRAVLLAPMDHILFSNRSQIHSSLKRYEKALRDAETVCRLMPHWSKGHVRKAQALHALGRTEEALTQYLFCLSIEPDCRLAKTEAYKLLSDLLAPVTDQVPEHILDSFTTVSSRANIKSSISAPSQTLCPAQFCPQSSLSFPPPAPIDPQHSHDRSEVCEVRGQGEREDRKLDHCFFVRKKRRHINEEGGEEASSDQKRSKFEPGEGIGSSLVLGGILDPIDLECSLCMRLFYEPVTTPCGHTFCQQCLKRCLDHNPKCPLCKEELSEYLVQRQYCKTELMEKLISKYFPDDLMERQKIHWEEMAELSNLNKNVPIFVCTMAFPTVPCPLHIFEPCYRLMIRRCMETGTNCFGMCLGDNLKGFADYGCLLEIRNVRFFSDGRSVVDTIGRRRFKVIHHSERDGYNTADIEYLEDVKVEGSEEQELQSLHDAVYDQALVWVNSLNAEQKERIEGHFGPMPEKDCEPQASPNGPSWCWWLLAVLPLEGRAQLPFLALTSLKDRLNGIHKVLLFMAHNRHR
ncbi:LON peptidase N-terminal domain and RING finger protein 3-like [Thalassophryne amazonica]|uniref:LON peptidase N-terminal domain and RING finger protein 3-like n=1 Tax=Thalassophryne amazonica TaxID=390379 RepID=UPI00147088AD|nr:LON peptidase N-terminal domain and RING finger protein 3-like [Thalassophryne amazonica]